MQRWCWVLQGSTTAASLTFCFWGGLIISLPREETLQTLGCWEHQSSSAEPPAWNGTWDLGRAAPPPQPSRVGEAGQAQPPARSELCDAGSEGQQLPGLGGKRPLAPGTWPRLSVQLVAGNPPCTADAPGTGPGLTAWEGASPLIYWGWGSTV